MRESVRGETMTELEHQGMPGPTLPSRKANTMQPLIDQNGPYQTIFFVVVAITVIPAALATLWLRVRPGASKRDSGSFFGIQTAAGLGILVAYWLARHFSAGTITPFRTEVFALGIALIPLGMLLNVYAVRHLGRYFTVQIAVRPDQPVVETGPYRFVRHPAYTGQLITILGVGVALTNWASVATILALTLVGYGYRIGVEERVLREALGAPYAEYMSRTRRLIPFIF
jgi:protein-S-isoprenylcysteine O-methyltransferase Ste14